MGPGPKALRCSEMIGVGMLRYRSVFAASCAALLLSSCAVGPKFSSPPTPDVARYTPELLSSPHSSPESPGIAGQRFIEGGDIPTRWWAAFRSQPLNDLIRLAAGLGSGDPGSELQRTCPARLVLPADQRQFWPLTNPPDERRNRFRSPSRFGAADSILAGDPSGDR